MVFQLPVHRAQVEAGGRQQVPRVGVAHYFERSLQVVQGDFVFPESPHAAAQIVQHGHPVLDERSEPAHDAQGLCALENAVGLFGVVLSDELHRGIFDVLDRDLEVGLELDGLLAIQLDAVLEVCVSRWYSSRT